MMRSTIAVPVSYDATGVILFLEYLSAEQRAALIAKAESLRPAGDYTPWMNPHLSSPLFLDLMRDPAIVSLVEMLVRGEPSGLQSEFFYCRPGTGGYAPHQDNFFVEAPYGCFVSCWIPLVDVSPFNGGLTVFPGSHFYGRLPVRVLERSDMSGQDPNAANEECIIPEGANALSSDLILKAGTLVFLHGCIVHASHKNNGLENRYAILNTYIRKGAPFRKGKRAQRGEVDLTWRMT